MSFFQKCRNVLRRTLLHGWKSALLFLADKQLLPVYKKRITFFSSPDYSDNARAMYDWLTAQGLDREYTCIWLLKNPEDRPEGISKAVAANSLRGCWTEMTAALHFYTHSPLCIPAASPNRLYLDLWHGCGYKDGSADSKKRMFDACIVPGPLFVESKSRFFGCAPEQLLPLGYPRYDLLRNPKQEALDILRPQIHLLPGEKLLFWMPTFRQARTGSYQEASIRQTYSFPLIQSEEELHRLDAICAQRKIRLVIKRHRNQIPSQEPALHSIAFLDDSVLRKLGIQLYEILPFTDGLLTDYSSIAVDYLLLDKPIGFTLDDFEEYRAKRGFIFENVLDYMPGTHIYTVSQLEQFLHQLADGADTHLADRAKMRRQMHAASDSCADAIWDWCMQYFYGKGDETHNGKKT